MGQADRDLIRDVLQGQPHATRTLIDRLMPIVHAEIGHLLLGCAPLQGRSLRQELEDLVQEVFAHLWAHDCKYLRDWAPEKGRSLDSWVRLIARSRVLDLLRSRRRNPWADEPTATENLDQASADLRAATLARKELAELDARLRATLSARDYALFLALYVEGVPVKDVAQQFAMSPDAVYQWRSRFARNILSTLGDEHPEGPP